MPLVLPPLVRELLVRGHRLLPAGVCGQVARDRRLNVNRLHLAGAYTTNPNRKDATLYQRAASLLDIHHRFKRSAK